MTELLEAHRRASAGFAELEDHHRCAWTAVLTDERCHNPGAISHGTRGDGPWYCAGHFVCTDGKEGAEIVELSRGFRPGDEVRFPAREKRLAEAHARAAEEALVQEEPGSGG